MLSTWRPKKHNESDFVSIASTISGEVLSFEVSQVSPACLSD